MSDGVGEGGMRWAADVPPALRAAAAALPPAPPGCGLIVQAAPDGRIVGADPAALRLLHHTWDTLTGVTSLDPRWHGCGADGRELPGRQHPAMVALATGEAVRGFVMGVEAPTPDGLGAFVWLEIDTDPVAVGATLVGVISRFRDVTDLPVGRQAAQRVIRAYRQAAHEAAAQGARFQAMVESSSDVIVEAADGGLVSWVSPSLQDVLGWTPDQLLGRPVQELVDARDRETTAARVRTLVADGLTSGHEEIRVVTADGGFLWMSAAWHRMLGDDGEVLGVLVAFRDVHADVERREALAHMAHHDGLTGLLNRDSAYAWMRSELRQAHATGRHLGVLCLDVDFFKEVNDTHGHPVGDRVLSDVADRLRAAVREDDMVARTGGDEFIVGLRVVPDEPAVERRAQAILDSVRELGLDVVGDVTVSIGLAVDDGTSDVDSIVERADAALYRAKRAGRNRFSW